tara:strand:+ start:279 stop:584 length:306 start_codon:yes stop_codon:yes gene_type:complete
LLKTIRNWWRTNRKCPEPEDEIVAALKVRIDRGNVQYVSRDDCFGYVVGSLVLWANPSLDSVLYFTTPYVGLSQGQIMNLRNYAEEKYAKRNLNTILEEGV